MINLLERNNFDNAIKFEYELNNYLSDVTSLLLCDIIASDLTVSCERFVI